MIATLHLPTSFRLVPCLDGEARPNTDLFDLTMAYRPGGQELRYTRVHVQSNLIPYLKPEDVYGLHLETLADHELARKLLPGKPEHVIMGALTIGNYQKLQVRAIPVRLKWGFRFTISLAVMSVVAGIAMLTAGSDLLVLSLLAIGSHVYRTGLSIPHLAFNTTKRIGCE